MTPARRALLLAPALPLVPALLALAACGGDRGAADEQRGGSGAPIGFELAMAATGADDTAPAATPAPVQPVTPADLWARIEAGTVRVIDVRTQAEVDSGIIPEAEHIPLDQFDPAKLDLSDGREVVLYCRSGRRSAIAAQQLAAAIGGPVEHLDGGMLAWEAQGLPVDKPEHLED